MKAVVTPRFACTYTGVASLGRDTAKWIARRLSAHVTEPDGGVVALTNALAAVCQSSRFVGRPLAVVLCGWVPGDSSAIPRITAISNFDPRLPALQVGPSFSIGQIDISPGRASAVYPLGQVVREDELAAVQRAVERLAKSGRDSPRAVAQVLTETVRSVARSAVSPYDSRQPTVSEDVLVVSLPRPDLCDGPLVVGKLVDDWWSVTSVLAGESRAERHGGPIVVGEGAAIRTLEPHEAPLGDGGLAGGLEIIVPPRTDGSALTVHILTDPPLGVAWGWPGSAAVASGP